MYVKGVNLGNWLVLEKWMSPALFEGTTAEDEYYLPTQLSPEVYEARIKVHRSEYISERDFAVIKRVGMNLVRIPVPYFIFGDRPPFIGCIKELDKAFDWAEKYGLQVLIDLHTAPLSQNGFDNGGICGVCKWSQTPEEVAFVLDVLERLAKRYGQRENLFGITPMNEPITENMWKLLDVPNRYRAVDQELAKGSGPNTLEFLQGFYEKAYERIHPNIREEAFVVFHDAFELKAWKEFLTRREYQGNVILDTHQYLMTAEALGCKQTLNGYIEYIQENFAADIAEVQQYVPVVVGEWSLFNAYIMDSCKKEGVLTPESKKHFYAQLANAQLAAWQEGSGYIYWNYKMLLDTVAEPQWMGWDCWDLGKSVELGWFPVENE